MPDQDKGWKVTTRVNVQRLYECKRYGSYALFDPDTPEEEIRKTIKAQAADMLEKLGALKIKVDMSPQPVEDLDGSVNFYVQAGWQIQIPSKEVQVNEQVVE